MITREINDIRLSEEAWQRLLGFYHRFCEGPLGAHYGIGHLLYACHAAFPLLLSTEMANLIWVNFKDYSYSQGGAGKIEPVAVADLLLSPLCRQTGQDRYEMNAEIRTWLLQLLRDGSWFSLYGVRTGGEGRLHELASFVWQYSTGSSEMGYDASRIRQLNEWAALAWLNPSLLAEKIAGVLESNDSTDNRNGQLWLHNQMDRLNSQLRSNIVEDGTGARSLTPFYNLYHYSKAKKDELLNRPADTVYESARQITTDGGGGGPQRLIRVKLSRPVAERTQRKLKEIQRVLVLDFSGTLRLLDPLIGKMEAYGGFEFVSNPSSSTPPASNVARVRQIIEAIRGMANPEDIILIYIPTDGPDSEYIRNILDQLESSPAQALLITNRLSLEGQHAAKTILLGTDPVDIGFREVQQLITACPGITYADLRIWLRFHMDNRGLSPLWVLLTPPGMAHDRFLSKKENFRGGKALLVKEFLGDRWQVIPEAFQQLPRSTNSTIYDYDTQDPVGERLGELVAGARPDENFYGGDTEAMDNGKLYLVGVERLPFRATVYCDGGDPTLEAERLQELVKEVFTPVGDSGYAWWDGRRNNIEALPGDNLDQFITDILDPGLFAIQVRTTPAKTYDLFYREQKTFTGASGILRLTGMDEEHLRNALPLISRYYYLKYLDQPEGPLRPGFKFDVNYWWIRPEGNAATFGGQTLVLDANAIHWVDGEVLVYPFGVEVYNREPFDLYCAVYLLCSNLSIWRLTESDPPDRQPQSQPGLLKPGQSVVLQFDDAYRLLQIGRGQMDASIKVLLSRDPVETNFSQSSRYTF